MVKRPQELVSRGTKPERALLGLRVGGRALRPLRGGYPLGRAREARVSFWGRRGWAGRRYERGGRAVRENRRKAVGGRPLREGYEDAGKTRACTPGVRRGIFFFIPEMEVHDLKKCELSL